MNTIAEQIAGGRRRRRIYSDEFKAAVVAACMQPGMSMAAVAMRHGINANLLRRWAKAAECGPAAQSKKAVALPNAAARSFVSIQLASAANAPDIRIELRRGATSVSVTWPSQAGAECAAWMRELLR